MMAISLNSYYKYFYISAQQARTITNEISKCLLKCLDSLKNRNNKTLEEISLQIKKLFFFSIQLEIVASFENVNKRLFSRNGALSFLKIMMCISTIYVLYSQRNKMRTKSDVKTKHEFRLGFSTLPRRLSSTIDRPDCEVPNKVQTQNQN